jgi:hypothetical protein
MKVAVEFALGRLRNVTVVVNLLDDRSILKSNLLTPTAPGQ